MNLISELVRKLRIYERQYRNGTLGRMIEETEEVLKEAADAIEMLLAKLEARDQNGEWIPCKIELPKTNGVYQVKRVVYEGCFKNYIVTCAYFDGQNTWHNDNRVNHGRPYLTDVIAWKTLDEPQKE